MSQPMEPEIKFETALAQSLALAGAVWRLGFGVKGLGFEVIGFGV